MRLSNNDDKVLTGKTAEQCAIACEQEVLFPCRSFDYDRANSKCYLSRADLEDSVVSQENGFDFYQMSMSSRSLPLYLQVFFLSDFGEKDLSLKVKTTSTMTS